MFPPNVVKLSLSAPKYLHCWQVIEWDWDRIPGSVTVQGLAVVPSSASSTHRNIRLCDASLSAVADNSRSPIAQAGSMERLVKKQRDYLSRRFLWSCGVHSISI